MTPGQVGVAGRRTRSWYTAKVLAAQGTAPCQIGQLNRREGSEGTAKSPEPPQEGCEAQTDTEIRFTHADVSWKVFITPSISASLPPTYSSTSACRTVSLLGPIWPSGLIPMLCGRSWRMKSRARGFRHRVGAGHHVRRKGLWGFPED